MAWLFGGEGAGAAGAAGAANASGSQGAAGATGGSMWNDLGQSFGQQRSNDNSLQQMQQQQQFQPPQLQPTDMASFMPPQDQQQIDFMQLLRNQ
jgi:hypothetical protein